MSWSGSGLPDHELDLDPPPGVLSGFEDEENVIIHCLIYTDNTYSFMITPEWTLQTSDDLNMGFAPSVIDPDTDERFAFELGGPYELTVEQLTPDLEEAVITCHETATDEREAVAQWTVETFRELAKVYSRSLEPLLICYENYIFSMEACIPIKAHQWNHALLS